MKNKWLKISAISALIALPILGGVIAVVSEAASYHPVVAVTTTETTAKVTLNNLLSHVNKKQDLKVTIQKLNDTTAKINTYLFKAADIKTSLTVDFNELTANTKYKLVAQFADAETPFAEQEFKTAATN
ncbi:hypothetical protein ACW95P_04425 [Candidatus Mycoplasma pogonae]